MGTRAGEVELFFGDRERTFRLGIGQWRKVQEKCDAGPAEIIQRLAPVGIKRPPHVKPLEWLASGGLGRWRIDDVREVILQGLLGGDPARTPTDANAIVRDNVDERELVETAPLALAIAMAAYLGPEDEDAAGERAGETDQLRSPEAKSGSDTKVSTLKAARSATRRRKSTP